MHTKTTASLDRRLFLAGLAAASGGAALGLAATRTVAGAEPSATEGALRSAGAERSKNATAGGRGTTRHVASEIKESKDPKTRARVRRLTGDGSSNVHPYFTSTAFIGLGAENVVLASNRSGGFQWYLLEIASGRLVQLTEGLEISPNMACVDPAGRLFYFDGRLLRSVRTDTLEDRELYRVPDGFKPALPSCTADGKCVAFAYCEQTVLSTETGRIYSTMHERYYQHPRSLIMRIDTGKGEAAAAWGETAWISHVLIHPTRPNLIVFCHEGGSTCVKQRMWTVDLDDRIARQAKPLYAQRADESCVHEYFTRQGDVGFQYSLEREGGREDYNCYIRPDGTWLRQFLLPGRRPGHIQSNSDNTLVVGDGGYLGSDDKDGNQYISLMTHPDGRAKVRRLCWHGTSGRTQSSHGHPSFSPDDRWVIYNSDAGGSDNIYMADVQSI